MWQRRQHSLLILGAGLLSIFPPLAAQGQKGAGGNEKPVSTAGLTRVETEVIEITNGGAFPNVIRRKSGKFVLSLVNKTSRDAAAGVVLTAVAPVAAKGVADTLGLTGFAKARRVNAVIDPPPGVYTLKLEATGKVLATITIE